MKRLLTLFALTALCCADAFASDEIQKLEELHQKAEQQIAVNNFYGAIDTYQEILFLEPDDETAYANSGQIYLLFSDFKRAKTAFQNALSINPENETALAGLKKIKAPDGYFYPETGPDRPSPPAPENSAGLTD